MYKLFAYWSAPKPEDVDAFEEYYISTHEMVFASREAMAQSAESPEWGTMRECSGAIIERFGVELSVEMGDEVTDTPGAG
jgi:hypothetical protein